MWLYFDRNGALKQKLEHGSPARSGTTDFAIFAYFEDLPSNEDYRIATMKLYRPDLENTAYPMLMMTECPMRYEYMESDGSQTYFEDGKDYVGYLFDFSHFGVSDYAPTVLLDMPGRWKAVISLIGPDGAPSVTGMCIFDVQEGITYQDGTDVTQDELTDNLIQQLSTRVRYGNVIFSVNAVYDGQDFSEEFDGYMQSMNFVVGQLFVDRSQSKFYKLTTLNIDAGTGVKTYTVEEWLPDVSNGYVTLGTNQTITGEKTFDANVFIPNSHNIIGDTNFHVGSATINASILYGYGNRKVGPLARSIVIGSNNNVGSADGELFNVACFADNSTVAASNTLTVGWENNVSSRCSAMIGKGLRTTTTQDGSLTIGSYNADAGADALFVVGKGPYSGMPLNAFEIKTNSTDMRTPTTIHGNPLIFKNLSQTETGRIEYNNNDFSFDVTSTIAAGYLELISFGYGVSIKTGSTPVSQWLFDNSGNLVPYSTNTGKSIGSSTAPIANTYQEAINFIESGSQSVYRIEQSNSLLEITVDGRTCAIFDYNETKLPGTLNPITSGGQDLGSPNSKWRNLYVNGITGASGTTVVTDAVINKTLGGYDTNNVSIIDYNTQRIMSIAIATTFTLLGAPTGNFHPEYRLKLTNSASVAVAATFTGVTHIITNDSNATISGNQITIPANATFEISIQDGDMVAINFEA